MQIPHHRETGEPRGFCLVEFESVKESSSSTSTEHCSQLPVCMTLRGLCGMQCFGLSTLDRLELWDTRAEAH